MELFLLIAIGLSLISFISVALTKTPAQTFSIHSFASEHELPEEQLETSVSSNDEPQLLPEKTPQKGSSGFLRKEEMLAHQAI